MRTPRALDVMPLGEVPEELLKKAGESGAAGVFYQRRLLTLWEKIYGWKGVALRGDNSLFVGYIRNTKLGEMFYSLPFGWYGGFVGDHVSEEFSSGIFGWLKSKRFIQENIVQYDDAERFVYPTHYEKNLLETHVIDLSKEVLYSENVTRNIAKSKESNLEVRRLSSGDRNSFREIMSAQQQMTGETRIIKSEFYDGLLELASEDKSGVEVLGAFRDRELVSSHIYLNSASDMFYFDGFSNETGRELAANFLLFDHMIERSKARGCQRFNLGASPKGDEGLLRFKKSWGAVPVKYVEYSRKSVVKRVVDIARGAS